MPISPAAIEELQQALRTTFRYDEAEDFVLQELENHVRFRRYVADSEIERRVTSRKKEESDILSKLNRRHSGTVESLRELEHNIVTDIVGARIVLDYQHQVQETQEFILQNSKAWRVVKVEDHVRQQTGYRSLHVDVVLDTTHHREVRCEIQVRTLLEHAFSTWTWPVYERYRDDPASIPDLLMGQLVQISNLLHHVDEEANRLSNQIQAVLH